MGVNMTTSSHSSQMHGQAADPRHLSSLDLVEASSESIARVPIEWARRMRALPVLCEGEPSLLMEDPMRHELLDDISLLLGVQPIPIGVDPALLDQAIELMYFEQASREPNWSASQADSDDMGAAPSTGSDLLSSADAAPVVQFVNQTLLDAVREGASDIHIEPESQQLGIRFRVDGLLYERPSPPQNMQAPLTARIKVMASLDIAEKRLPQDGTARVRVGRREIDVRVSTIPVAEGERIVLRLLHRDQVAMGLSELGMPANLLSRFQSLLKEPNGVIWVTGPTGSGKTTTLYAALRELDRAHLNILTIEDPVEYRLDGIGQMSVKPSIGLSFATGLRHVLRQDPDVVLVGETRDEETAEIVTRASMTGHLVFSTLHTNDAVSAFTRLLDMGIAAYLLSGSTRASLAQRLVRKVCPACRQASTMTAKDVPAGVADPASWVGTDVYTAVGCSECKNGYRGRIGLYELLIVDEALQKAIRPGCTLSELSTAARLAGYRSLMEDGLDKVRAGMTTLEELDRVLGMTAS